MLYETYLMLETIPSDFSFRLNFFHLKTKKRKEFLCISLTYS